MYIEHYYTMHQCAEYCCGMISFLTQTIMYHITTFIITYYYYFNDGANKANGAIYRERRQHTSETAVKTSALRTAKWVCHHHKVRSETK